MIRRTFLFFCLICASAFPLAAQGNDDSHGVLSLSLRDAQDYAIEHNRTLMNSSLDVRKAEAGRWASIASMLPQVTGSLSHTNYMGSKLIFMEGMDMFAPAIDYGLTAAVAVGGQQIISTQLGTISMKMADVTMKQTEQEIAEQVKLLYFSALVTEETVKLLEKNLESMKKLHAYSSKSVEVGVAEKVDADQILVQVATMETTISSTKRSQEMIYNSLRLQMNLGFDVEIDLIQSLSDLLNVESSLALLYDEFTPKNNYTYQLVLQNTELSRKQMKMAGWAYGPTLSVAYVYTGKSYLEGQGFRMSAPNTMQFSLSIPIFSSGKNYNTLRSAKYDYQKQQNLLADTEMSLKIQHRQLRYNLSSAYERYQTQKKNVEVSQSVLDNMSKKYEFGLSSALDVTNASTNFITAQSNYVQAALEFVTAQIELEKLLNKNYLYE